MWEISPGYLNDDELRAQRQLVVSLLTDGHQSGPASGDEAKRWSHYGNALQCAAAWLAAECELRDLPVADVALPSLAPTGLAWPAINAPAERFIELQATAGRSPGRIPLPNSTQSLWAQHKYSVAARSMEAYRSISVKVATSRGRDNFAWLASEVCLQLRLCPEQQSLRDALLQMWGYVAGAGAVSPRLFDDLPALFAEIQRRAHTMNIPYLTHATALSELRVWLP
ncbi:hypothetical protein [Simiduia aestuariiviva]|uniref:Uncharacterized protein n=1 Tax=Simiduia aestuariiviva TaxID=1510459 RepID=A0A839UM37_9GAMM|nr:hypothetical protein [Simiduia aestuariiviva]MBB3167609.1 hypothetical protein [Simiduia aestuariiviva]